MHSIVTTFREAVIKVEVANFGVAIDTLIDQDGCITTLTVRNTPILIYQGVQCCTKICNPTLMTAPLKVVTIECIEHEVTCLNERVFIKTMNHLLTNCSQSTLLAMICRLSLLVLNTS